MRILIISTYDLNGGAGKAAFRLLNCLDTIRGLESKMFVFEKTSNNENVIQIQSFWVKYFRKFIQAIDNLFLVLYPKRDGAIFSTAWISAINLNKKIKEFDPDIINIHWINNGFISLSQIKAFPKHIPLVFSLHDQWLMTGGCHMPVNCEKYLIHCSSCLQLHSDNNFDLSSVIFNAKKNLLTNRDNLYVIGLSHWMKQTAEKSELLKGLPIFNFPNPIDSVFFKPQNKDLVREVLGITTNKKIMLFGAVNSTTDKRKGFHLLMQAISMLDASNYFLIVFGNTNLLQLENLGLEYIQFGQIHDELTIRSIINASDVFLLPSLQENLSNSVMESLSCGVPVVAFDIGGNSDLIKHKVNGYLANPFDVEDFSDGIEYVLEKSEVFSTNARNFVESNFDYEVVGGFYHDFFKKIIIN